MEIFFLFLVPIFIFIINSLLKKYTLISNYSGENHQRFAGNKIIPLSGGIFFTLFGSNIYFHN